MTLSENLIYSLFSGDNSDNYKKTLIYITFLEIESNQGITESSLFWELRKKYGYAKRDIITALACLTNINIFGSVSRFEVKDTKAVHLRVRSSKKWDNWIQDNDFEKIQQKVH